jgi:putative nucleotidyltransferase with HDIG domain
MICTKRARRFADVDLKIFDVLARQSALAIANIGLYDKMSRKVKEKAREMTMLFTMSRSLSSAVDIDTMLSIILEKARLLMRARFAVIRVFGSSRKALSILAQAGLSDNKARILAALEDKLSSNVMRGGNPCIINDIEAHFGDKLPAYLKKNRIRSIVIVPLFSAKRRTGTLSVYMPGIRIFTGEEINMIEMVASLASVAIDNSVMLERIRKDYLNMVKTLAKIIDANDSYTRGHCDKVMKYSLAICRRLNIPGRDVNTIKTASLLHDIGKIGIDLSVIHKTDKLTAKDWQSIRMHPEIGAKIVAQVGFLNDIVPIIKHHHARYNGGGYPDPRRKRNRIPLGSRIIAVADAYDAMTSNRPYRKAMSKEDAIAELRKCSGSQFDPEVVKALVNS